MAAGARGGGRTLTAKQWAVNPMTLRRAAVILLLVSMGALGTGLLGQLHAAVHPGERAGRLIAASCPDEAGHPGHEGEEHSHCRLDLLLKAPVTSYASVQTLVFAGPFVEFLTIPARPLISARVPCRLDCRGPPAP